MRYLPDRESFCSLAKDYSVVPVYCRLMADALTPVSAFKRIDAGAEWSFLFESVVGGERIGRYSFLGANPFHTLSATRHEVRIDGAAAESHPDPLLILQRLIGQYSAPPLPGLPRFLGGAVGFAGYDTVRYLENLPNAPTDDRRLPDLQFGLFDRMVVFDHVDKTVLVVTLVRIGENARDDYTHGCRAVDDLVERLRQPQDGLTVRDFDPGLKSIDPPASNMTAEQYRAMVTKAKEYIMDGDIFQVVLSQRFESPLTADPFEVYRALRVVSPSPFMFFVKQGDLTLVGASPEIMCRTEAGIVTNRPLAGTRHRGSTEDEDKRLADELLADPKERAEHIMLVDLARNDVGRVSEVGSVAIKDLMTVERYSHVMHISSTVTGKLKAGLTAFDALRTALPAGTLSGAPKVRAMEIIDELEPHRRGPYGGAVGYIDFAGNMDTCIALRTMVIHDRKAYVQAGAGIVADSDPEAEYQETVNKAMSLLRALAAAKRLSGS